MKDFLENIIKNLVNDPQGVAITESQDDQGRILFTISVADDDMGRVIGKSGKVINSIRTILRVMAIRQSVKVRIDLEDKGQPTTEAAVDPVPEQETADTSAADLVSQPEEEASTMEITAQSPQAEAPEMPEAPEPEPEPAKTK